MPDRRDPRHQELRLHGQRLLSISEAAERLEVSKKKIATMIRAGVLSTVSLGGRTVRIPEHDVAVLVCRKEATGAH